MKSRLKSLQLEALRWPKYFLYFCLSNVISILHDRQKQNENYRLMSEQPKSSKLIPQQNYLFLTGAP